MIFRVFASSGLYNSSVTQVLPEPIPKKGKVKVCLIQRKVCLLNGI
nr:MAG TPA: hypothetical protein [Caudoviricetes sp.]